MHILILGLECTLEAPLLLHAKLHRAGASMQVFDYTCTGPYKFLMIPPFDYTCVGLDMYLSVHVCLYTCS